MAGNSSDSFNLAIKYAINGLTLRVHFVFNALDSTSHCYATQNTFNHPT